MYVWHGVSELVEVRLSGHLEAYEDEDDRHRQARHRDASVITAQHRTPHSQISPCCVPAGEPVWRW